MDGKNNYSQNKQIFKKPLQETGIYNKTSFVFYFILTLLAVFIIFLLWFLVQYVRQSCGPSGKMDYFTYIKHFDPYMNPCKPDITEQKYEEREVKQEKEVFNIDDQIYTYPEAFEKCKAYGGELASYQQIVDAYNNGAEWTNYGWSKGQKAFYPIQPCSFVKLRRQGINIGPPGVNGGKFEEYLRFGANCYGIRPPGSVTVPKDPLCIEDGETELCRENPDACKILDTDKINPFSREKKWSRWDK